MGLEAALNVPPTRDRPRIAREAGVLAGSRCRACGAPSWPARAICHRCGEAAMAPVEFSSRGRLLTHTTVWVQRPGIPAPYTLGQVKIDDGPLVFGHVIGLKDSTTVPAPVRIVLDPDPAAVPPFRFKLEEAG